MNAQQNGIVNHLIHIRYRTKGLSTHSCGLWVDVFIWGRRCL